LASNLDELALKKENEELKRQLEELKANTEIGDDTLNEELR
jgi:hypothetical protein